jgi:hypothetical protein
MYSYATQAAKHYRFCNPQPVGMNAPAGCPVAASTPGVLQKTE